MVIRFGALAMVAGAIFAALRHMRQDDPLPDDEAPPPKITYAEAEAAITFRGDDQGLNTGTSIVDVLKALGQRSDKAFRKGLAREVGFQGNYDPREPSHNVELRRLVIQAVADGKFDVPEE